jgi:hypothetical protein
MLGARAVNGGIKPVAIIEAGFPFIRKADIAGAKH